MSVPNSPELFEEVQQLAHERYGEVNSFATQRWIERVYRERGGRYNSCSPPDCKDPFDVEGWIDVQIYLETGRKVRCSEANRDCRYCLPERRLHFQSGPTLFELLEQMGREGLLRRAKQSNQK